MTDPDPDYVDRLGTWRRRWHRVRAVVSLDAEDRLVVVLGGLMAVCLLGALLIAAINHGYVG